MFKKTLLVSAIAIACASPAHALVKVANFDWTTPFGTFNDIASIVMAGLGNNTVQQEVDSSGNLYVGAKFSEFGTGFSVSYVDKNNVQGNFGFITTPEIVNNSLYFDFSGLSGTVSNILSNGTFQYAFNPTGTVTVSYGAEKGTATTWFVSPVLGINGSGAANIGLNTQGSSEILSVAVPGAGTFQDENNNSLSWFQNLGGLFFDTVTTNTILTAGAAYDCDGTGPSTQQCKNLGVDTTGKITLYRIPEPGSLALAGLGLLGAGIFRRRTKVAAK